MNVVDRFFKRVCKTDTCWLWVGGKNRFGYGKFTIGRRTLGAHRFAYEQFTGPIPAGLTIDHLCRNRACVNPAHLEAVSLRENLLRGNTFQAANAKKSHCVNGHAFTDRNTLIVNGWRQCRECRLKRQAEKRRADGRRARGRYQTKLTR